jgi:hypothetical protein
MMHSNNNKTRGLALFTGGVLAASALFHPAPVAAQEKDHSKAYKTGAIVLGAAAAYMAVKGKTLPAAAAAAGAYYAYKKGRKDDRDSDPYAQYPQYPGQYPNYSQYPGYQQPSSYPNNSYPGNYPTNNYPSNNYPTYNAPTNYPSGGYGGGYNQYPNSFSAPAPTNAAPSRRNNVVLR